MSQVNEQLVNYLTADGKWSLAIGSQGDGSHPNGICRAVQTAGRIAIENNTLTVGASSIELPLDRYTHVGWDCVADVISVVAGGEGIRQQFLTVTTQPMSVTSSLPSLGAKGAVTVVRHIGYGLWVTGTENPPCIHTWCSGSYDRTVFLEETGRVAWIVPKKSFLEVCVQQEERWTIFHVSGPGGNEVEELD